MEFISLNPVILTLKCRRTTSPFLSTFYYLYKQASQIVNGTALNIWNYISDPTLAIDDISGLTNLNLGLCYDGPTRFSWLVKYYTEEVLPGKFIMFFENTAGEKIFQTEIYDAIGNVTIAAYPEAGAVTGYITINNNALTVIPDKSLYFNMYIPNGTYKTIFSFKEISGAPGYTNSDIFLNGPGANAQAVISGGGADLNPIESWNKGVIPDATHAELQALIPPP